MDNGKTSRRKKKPVRHRSGTLDDHYKRDRGPDLKITSPIFKGKKHDDPDVHIQAFEQYAELKHIMEEKWGEYFSHTLKEAARKWYFHYPASKLQVYKKLKKAFILEYTDDRGDEDILCELDRIKQGKMSVRKYVQKIKELTRRLNEPPSKKIMRAWFLSGFNSRKLREQDLPASTKKFKELGKQRNGVPNVRPRTTQQRNALSAIIVKHLGTNGPIVRIEFIEGKGLSTIEFASMEPVAAITGQAQSANTNTSGYNGRGRGRGRGGNGNTDFKRNFNCYKCGKYGHFAAQCQEPDKPAVTEAKQPEPVPVRAIKRSSGVVIE
ncbi:hypothetical protein L7F22_010384 [Adiantum nelumboides]|nr:hypothetical protein [Adiantum nelumboides]